MDVCESEALQTQSTAETSRRPLVPADNKNGTTHHSRTREVSSRYRSPSLSATNEPKRCPSPNSSRKSPTPTVSAPKRAISAERKRPSRPSTPPSPTPSTPMQDTSAEMLLASKKVVGNRFSESLWPSTMRSLSVSFQSDAISVPTSKKEKPVSHTLTDRTLRPSSNITRRQAETPASRKPTPERKRSPMKGNNSDQSENSKPVDTLHARLVDQHRWPSGIGGKVSSGILNRSIDLTDRVNRTSSLLHSGMGVPSLRRLSLDGASKPLQKSSSDLLMLLSRDDSGNRYLIDDSSLSKQKPRSSSSSDRRLSLNSATKAQSVTNPGSRPPSPSPSLSRGVSPSRTKATNPSRPSSPALARPSSPALARPSSPSLARPSSPSLARPSSPSLARPSSPSLARPSSPSLARPSSPSRQPQSSTSVLSFIVDVKKGKKAANHIEDVHQLRLLYNRHLQWRYANARTDAALHSQKVKAEDMLYSMWRTTVNMLDSVVAKRIHLQQLSLRLKIYSVLSNNLTGLNEWASFERDHVNSLTSSIKDLQSSTIRIPITGGAMGDIETLKAAVCSAVDVMQTMVSSLCSILPQVEGMNHLVSELADIASQERALLDEYESLTGSSGAFQVEEHSLRTHILQLKQKL